MRNLNDRRPEASGGFTLIELMITVAIIAVLASVAVPGYMSYVSDTRRADGREVLLSTAQRLERCYTTHGSYNDGDCNVSWPVDSSEGYYRIPDPGGNLTASAFTLAANPRGGQSGDKCGNLTLTETGAKGVTGAGAGVGDCW